jgi:hypothetical protein
MIEQRPEEPGRFATVGDGSGVEPGDRFYREELQLAFRNRGMPLEALRYPITPTGLHYLLTHFDIPDVDPLSFRLEVGGLVARQLSLSLQDVRSRPSVTLAVTMECAGNGRALLSPRPISQPWLVEAIGTAEWSRHPAPRCPRRSRRRSARRRDRVHRARPRRAGRRGAGLPAEPSVAGAPRGCCSRTR